MRSHVVKIDTSIKIGAATQCGPKTIIIGANRAGKSTIVNAIEAAGSGRVSDVAGRATLALDAELMTLAPDNADKVTAKVKLSTGEFCEWNLERGHRAKRKGPEIAFPLRDVREAILGSPDKARKWILRHGGEVTWDSVVEEIPKSLRKRLAALVVGWNMEESGAAAALAGAIDAAKERVRSANALVKSNREIMKVSGQGTPPTDKEIEEATVALQSVKAGNIPEVREARAALTKLVDERAEASTRLASLPRVVVTPVMQSALIVIEALAAAKATQCAICGNAADPESLAQRAANARSKLDSTLKVVTEAEALNTKLRVIDQRLVTLRLVLARNGAVDGADEGATGDPVAASNHLAELQRRRAGWDAAKRAEENALENERAATEWSQLSDALSKALGTLVEKARATFEKKVQDFLPESWRFGVDLVDGDREVLRIGLRTEVGPDTDGPGTRNEVLRSALSGSEWATVTAALALATAPADGPVVIAPEERAFDEDTLATVLEAFGAIGDAAQVIITSPVYPTRIPAGWTVVELGGKRRRKSITFAPKDGVMVDTETGEPAMAGAAPQASTIADLFK